MARLQPAQWDGRHALPLVCGDGPDSAAGPDPLRSKAALVASLCSPDDREAFIAALSRRHHQ
jgi:hypothetical protein